MSTAVYKIVDGKRVKMRASEVAAFDARRAAVPEDEAPAVQLADVVAAEVARSKVR